MTSSQEFCELWTPVTVLEDGWEGARETRETDSKETERVPGEGTGGSDETGRY